MKQEDRDKNRVEKVPHLRQDFGGQALKILIPAVNEYPLKLMKKWAKNVYHQARLKVGWRKAKKIKAMMPIETAAYAEEKTFGNWRLVAPDGPDKISPLQQVITLIRPYIVETRWGEFRRDFVREIKIDFNAICDADYDPAMVDEVNRRLNQLLSRYTCLPASPAGGPVRQARGATTPRPTGRGSPKAAQPPLLRGNGKRESPLAREDQGEKSPLAREDQGEKSPLEKGDQGGCVKINFVLKPETAQGYSSPEFLKIRSRIWERFTGQPLDLAMFQNPAAVGRQMEMYLSLTRDPSYQTTVT